MRAESGSFLALLRVNVPLGAEFLAGQHFDLNLPQCGRVLAPLGNRGLGDPESLGQPPLSPVKPHRFIFRHAVIIGMPIRLSIGTPIQRRATISQCLFKT